MSSLSRPWSPPCPLASYHREVRDQLNRMVWEILMDHFTSERFIFVLQNHASFKNKLALGNYSLSKIRFCRYSPYLFVVNKNCAIILFIFSHNYDNLVHLKKMFYISKRCLFKNFLKILKEQSDKFS